MTALWPSTRLSEVVSLALEPVRVEPARIYPMAGVYSFGRGLFAREDLPGTQTTYKVLHQLSSDALVLSQLKGWEGALAVVPPELERRFLSPQFATFHARRERLDVRFLGWWCRQSSVWEALRHEARGMGARRDSVSPARFLTLEIPVPPLAEQRRVVARIEGFKAKLDDAKGLRRLAEVDARQIVAAAEMRIWPTESAEASALSDVTTYLARGRQSKQGLSSHTLIKTQHVQQGRLLGSDILLAPEVASKVPAEARVRENDILIACSAAGCLGRVAQFSQPGVTASTDTHVAIARADPDRVSPDYLYAYLRGAQGQMQLRSREKGDWRREKVGF